MKKSLSIIAASILIASAFVTAPSLANEENAVSVTKPQDGELTPWEQQTLDAMIFQWEQDLLASGINACFSAAEETDWEKNNRYCKTLSQSSCSSANECYWVSQDTQFYCKNSTGCCRAT